MSIQFAEVDTTDYNLTYYMNNLYTKFNCALRSYVKTNVFEANEIIPGIYLGDINSAYDKQTLKDLKITHVISVLSGFVPPYQDDFNYLVLDALDTVNTNLFDNFETTNKFIEDAFDTNGKVLIHCMAGRSRSVTILAAFMIKTFGINVNKVLNAIRIKRSIVQPNDYFIIQLEKYYDSMYPKQINHKAAN